MSPDYASLLLTFELLALKFYFNFSAFILVISAIVFVHEFGHYFVAKLCGVKILTFSIGFGKEITGWNDRSGTRWKISMLPLGGYVKMYGDSSEASTPDEKAIAQMTEAEKKLSFHHKSLWQKALVVAAGPLANFLLTIAIFTYFGVTSGIPSTEPIVGEVIRGSAAEEAGLKPGDRVVLINGEEIATFHDISPKIATNLGAPVDIIIEREGTRKAVQLTPRKTKSVDPLGNEVERPLIGISSAKLTYKTVGIGQAVIESVKSTYEICTTTLKVIGQMVSGQRSPNELKGPLGIAELSGQAVEKASTENGLTILWFIAMLSANLGFFNLLPVPMLDGGHLLYYMVEALRGKPMARKAQEFGYRLGFALLITLMAFTIINDFRNLL